MKTQGRYLYIDSTGKNYKEVYSPDNPPPWSSITNKPVWIGDSKPSYTKSEIGLGNVANERQYSANNPPPNPLLFLHSLRISSGNSTGGAEIFTTFTSYNGVSEVRDIIDLYDLFSSSTIPCSGIIKTGSTIYPAIAFFL